MHPSNNKPCYMRDIRHVVSFYLVSYLCKSFEVYLARVSCEPGKNKLRLFAQRYLSYFIIIEHLCFLRDPIRNGFEHLPGEIDSSAMRQIPAMCKLQPHELVAYAQHGIKRCKVCGAS